VKKPKRQKRPRNSNAREHAQITRKVIAKTINFCLEDFKCEINVRIKQ
jgi:hypothetical protein